MSRDLRRDSEGSWSSPRVSPPPSSSSCSAAAAFLAFSRCFLAPRREEVREKGRALGGPLRRRRVGAAGRAGVAVDAGARLRRSLLSWEGLCQLRAGRAAYLGRRAETS